MKLWLAILLTWAAVSAGPAAASPWRDAGREMLAAQGRSDRDDRGVRRQRDARQPERVERREGRHRLSDEERRELLRDLDKAQRELYQPRRERNKLRRGR